MQALPLLSDAEQHTHTYTRTPKTKNRSNALHWHMSADAYINARGIRIKVICVQRYSQSFYYGLVFCQPTQKRFMCFFCFFEPALTALKQSACECHWACIICKCTFSGFSV